MCNTDPDDDGLDDSYIDYGADVDYMVNSEPGSDLYNEMISKDDDDE